ncbi:hypothetical protein [Williamsia sp. 1138]|uniref:hypothetical protein n=1 Tax=Williamsia sp. 1138 TaxID=1903117 RepID=UPI00117C0E15|nr:hypothetical protein [Williamsia sp. 1138]
MKAIPESRAQSLLSSIEASLRVSGQYLARCEAADTARVQEVRSAGRRVGRILGWSVRTVVSPPAPDRTVNVSVVVLKSTPLHEELMRIRDRKAMRKVIDGFKTGLYS